MTTQDFILTLFCQVDDQMAAVPKRPDAKLYPSEVVTLALLFAIKGVGTRAFYRWLLRDYQACFPHVPERTRLFRLFKARARHGRLSFWLRQRSWGLPTAMGSSSSIQCGQGAARTRSARKGKVIIGGSSAASCVLCVESVGFGLCVGLRDGNVHDAHFHPLIAQFVDIMIVLTDTGFHAKTGEPANMKVCQRGTWNGRMLVETIFSLLTTVFHGKKLRQRVWEYFQARVAWTMAAFNLLAQWGLELDDSNFLHLSIAEFRLGICI